MPDVRLAYAPASSYGSFTGRSSASSSRQLLGRTISVHKHPSLRPIGRVELRVAAPRPPERSLFVGVSAIRHASFCRWPSRFRIVGTPAHLTLPDGPCATQAREPRRTCNVQRQRPAAIAQTPAVPNSCEPPQGLQSSRSSGAVPIRIHIRNATASLTPACSGLATLAADARR